MWGRKLIWVRIIIIVKGKIYRWRYRIWYRYSRIKSKKWFIERGIGLKSITSWSFSFW